MTDPVDVPLGTATLVRKWRLEVNTGTDAAPVWTKVYGISNLQLALNPTLQDDSDYDSAGYKSQAITAIDWSIVATLMRKTLASDPTSYDPGQEAIRTAALNIGNSNSVGVRVCEMGTARVEAYQGHASVTWSPQGGSMDALESVQATLTGRGQRTAITHPYPLAPAAPVINSLTPSTVAAAGGDEVEIHGTGFLTATAVTVNGSALASSKYVIQSDNLITFSSPAHAAGAGSVTVTNPTGTSGSTVLTYV
jgi:hypothetical protein